MTTMVLKNTKTLILNADMSPLRVAPLSLWDWQEAIVAVWQGRVHLVETYDMVVKTAREELPVPSVVALKTFVQRKRVAFTRYNVYLRDAFRCQFCGKQFEARDLTFDHVLPQSKGGKTEWKNIVACCHGCNTRKGSKLLKDSGMVLLRHPYVPTAYELDEQAKKLPIKEKLHETWLDYLYWDTSLEN